jgi:hypothetical protein
MRAEIPGFQRSRAKLEDATEEGQVPKRRVGNAGRRPSELRKGGECGQIAAEKPGAELTIEESRKETPQLFSVGRGERGWTEKRRGNQDLGEISCAIFETKNVKLTRWN